MGQYEFIGMLVLAVGGVAGIVTPIVKLTAAVTELNTTMRSVIKEGDIRDKRLDEHGREIDSLNRAVDRHELRLNALDGCGKDDEK